VKLYGASSIETGACGISAYIIENNGGRTIGEFESLI